MPTFSVILKRRERQDPVALAKIMAAVRKTPAQDQMRPAKSAWGIIEMNLEESAARVLSGQLSSAGLACAMIADDALPVLPAAEPLKRFEPGCTTGLVLIAAAGLTVTTTTTKTVKQGPTTGEKLLSTGILLTTGLPIRIGGGKGEVKKEQTQSEMALYADFLYRNPLRRLRIDAQQFDYSFLKDRKLYHGLGNFKLLLGEAARCVPTAWKNHGAQVLLESQPLKTLGYESLDNLERETRWLLTLLSVGTA